MDPSFTRSAAEAAAAPTERLAYVVAFDRAGERPDALSVLDVDEARVMERQRSRTGQHTLRCACSGIARYECAVRCGGLSGVFDAGNGRHAAVAAQRIRGRAMTRRAAKYRLIVVMDDFAQQTHRSRVWDQSSHVRKIHDRTSTST